MTKQSGLGDNLYVAGFNLSGDTASFDRIGGGPALGENTGIDKAAVERLGLIRDASMSLSSWFNKSPGQAHPRWASLPTADQVVTYCRGTALGNQAAGMLAKQLNYDGTRETNGNLAFKVEAASSGFGLEWGRQLTAGRRTDSGAANGTGVDFGTGSTAFGLQAYLHVFAFTGTSATIKLQESQNDGSPDTYADVTGGGFATVSGVTSERIQTGRTQTVERWLRVVTTGTFSNLVFAVMVNRNDVSTVF